MKPAAAHNGLAAAGLVATNSIRGGANRKVLKAIVDTTQIFEAWSDEGWVNEGAAVRVSLVCFGHAPGPAVLNGNPVSKVHPDLTGADARETSNDLTTARRLQENLDTAYVGVQRNGSFDIAGNVARYWLAQPNPNRRSNAEVLQPTLNAMDITRRHGDRWLIDFGLTKQLEKVVGFEAPFQHVLVNVKPTRIGLRRAWHATYWWLFGDPRPAMRKAIAPLSRYIVTPQISKHRVFVFVPSTVLTENANIALARADDVTFGVLQSRLHELWALGMCTWLGVGNDPRYTNSTTFETFPFPAGVAPANTAHQRTEALPDGALIPADISAGPVRTAVEAIARASKRLNDLRETWLNPPEWTQRAPEVVPLGMSTSPYPDRIVPRVGLSEADAKALQKRTLTNLYNLWPAWLDMAHRQLDAAVATAYGWADYTADMPDEEILRRLLALNLQRANT